MKRVSVPPEFNDIAHLLNYVHQKSNNEFSSSCPSCGGSIHPNGEPPDRFILFRVSRYGFPLGFCRVCGYRWYDKKNPPSGEDIELFRQQQIEVEKARMESAKRSLELLQNDRMWERFYDQNNEYSREMFRGWGIAESWQQYLRLGLVPDYVVKSGEESYHSPAISIPIWNVGGVVQNIKLRVTNPHSDRDRYRNWYPMGSSYLFVPRHEEPLTGTGILVEGEKKAIVLEQTLDTPSLRVIGLQTKTPSSELFGQLKNMSEIYVWLDPDGFNKEGKESAVEYVTRMIGKERVLIVNCPEKLDDGIVQHGLEPRRYLSMARKAQ